MNTENTTTGEYKTKTKFTEFIGGKGFINFISNEAYIDGNQLSGLEMDGLKFKLTILDDGSVNFDEVDTDTTTKSQRGRLLEIIEEKTIGVYRNRSIVQELNFISVAKVKDREVPLYLAVDVMKPIDQLSDLLSDTFKATESALENLDSLFNSWMDDDFIPNLDEIDLDLDDDDDDDEFPTSSPNDKDMSDLSSDYITNLDNSFEKLKSDKLIELKSNLSKKETELSKLNYQLKSTQNDITSVESDIKLLEDRISDIQPSEDLNGFLFFVSERQNEVVSLNSETEKIIRDKVSQIKSINVDNFMKLFYDGEFHIKLGTRTDDGFDFVADYTSLSDDIKSNLSKLDVSISEDKLIYSGELTWGQLVTKLIKFGFEENEDFNKFCGSNSYQSNTETKEEVKTKKTKF
jgi:hypothetical protein